MTTLLIILAVLLVIAFAALALLKAMAGGTTEGGKGDVYYLKPSLFSPAERSFLGVLESIDYEGVSILGKVRLADVFGLKKGLERSARQRALNRISAKHVDFLLVQKSDGRPLLGIELDDRSHEREDRVARDAWVDTLFASARLPLLHIAARATYDPKELHRQIEAARATAPRA